MSDTSKTNITYCFLHIPKTAGSTFRLHLEKHFSTEERLPVYYVEEFHNLVSNTPEYFSERADIDSYLSSLSTEQKDKIKCIYGHQVYYGIHRHFEGEFRYVTFMREPIKRNISAFNFYHHSFITNPKEPAWNKSRNYRDSWQWISETLTKDGAFITFDEWTNNTEWSNFVLKFLEHRNFITVDTNKDTNLVDPFKQFYFVGVVDNFTVDSMFLYHELGIHKFFPDQNIAQKRHDIVFSRKNFIAKNSLDIMLYEAAVSHNITFKKRHRFTHYMKICLVWMCKMRYQIGAIVSLNSLYRLSAVCKKHSNLYTGFISVFKK